MTRGIGSKLRPAGVLRDSGWGHRYLRLGHRQLVSARKQ